jgi:phenylpropionate dioxygenase-like ring-hydroxylating dioxygenase large terminal subunit
LTAAPLAHLIGTMSITGMQATRPIDYGSLVREGGLHGSVYTDPAIFEDEMHRIFGQGWVYVGHESEIPEPGDYRLTNVGTRPLIFSRDDDGRVHLLFNRCRHRAATVCQGDRGNASFFRCAYHGWTYRNDGRLVGVPYPGGYGSDFRKEEWGLVGPPRVAAYRGFVFASLAADGPSLDDHLGDLVKEQIDLFVDLSPAGQLDCRAGTTRFVYRGNWKLQLENTADGYHINLLHRSLLDVLAARGRRIDDMNDEASPALNVSLGRGHTLMDMRPYNAAKPSLRDQVLKGGGPEAAYVEAMEKAYGRDRAKELITAGGTHLAVWPNLGVLAGMIRRIHPVRVDLTEVILTPALLVGASDSMNEARLRGHEAFFPPAGLGGTDDQEIFERVQVGLQADTEPWLLIARGLDRETRESDGRVTSQVTGETNTRAIFRHWQSVMCDATTEQP